VNKQQPEVFEILSLSQSIKITTHVKTAKQFLIHVNEISVRSSIVLLFCE